MYKRFIKRPLALFSTGFTLAALVFHYQPAFFIFIAALALAVAVVSALVRRNFSGHVMLVAVAVVAGFLWCVAFSAFLSEPYGNIAAAASVGDGIFKVPFEISKAIGGSIDSMLPSRVAPFVRAITIGDVAALKKDAAAYTPIMMSGIAHIVAVSGMHVTFLISMLSPLLRGRRSRAIILTAVLLLFMGVSGFSPSVSRAVIMHSFILFAPLAKRRSDPVTSVFTALLMLIIVNPASVTSVGLQLSFLSTLGLVLFNPKISSVFTGLAESHTALKKPVVRLVYRFVTGGLSTSLAALALSLPLTAYYFGYIAIYAPVTNLLTLWAASFAFCGGLIAALLGLVLQPLGMAAGLIAALPADWVITVERLISRIPYAAVYVSNDYIIGWMLYLYASIVLLIALRGRLRAIIWTAGGAVVTLVLALLLTGLSPAGGLEITVLDVGQGQSIAVTDGSASAIIDCGGTYASAASMAAAAYMQERATSPVDVLILTHFHFDHAGGVPDLLMRERFDKLIIPEPELGGTTELEEQIISLATELGIDIIIVTEKLEISFGSSVITIYPPFGELDENEACLTILISDGSWDALITGDMPSGTELLLIENVRLPDVEVYVAGHHGSKYSSGVELLEEITPEIVIISVSAGNSYGHPSDEALERFEDIGAEVYRTDELGNITIKSGAGAPVG